VAGEIQLLTCMLENGEYIWSDTRKGQAPADYRRSEPDVISIEELSDNGLTDRMMP
jgi:hypothetical protein